MIFVADLGEIAQKFKEGDSLLLRTDWSKRLGTEGYHNDLPRISAELANWCVEKKVQILGVEPPSVADVNNLPEVTEIHHILLRGGILIVEGLINLDVIEKQYVELIALPLKIKKGDGAPCRVIAIEKEVDLIAEIHAELKRQNKSIIILDDDPTGTQTVHSVPILTTWTQAVIQKKLAAETPVFFHINKFSQSYCRRSQSFRS